MDENASRAFSRVPPVKRAWLAAPESVNLAGNAIAASPLTSELTTPWAIIKAVSSNAARAPLTPIVSERPRFPETRSAPLPIVRCGAGDGARVDECLVAPPSARSCQELEAGCHRANTLPASARESIAAKFALRST